MNVEELLTDKEQHFIPKGGDFLIRCLNPEHEDKSPSLRIDKVTGIFNCFSCGFAGNIFTYYGEKANQLDLRKELLKRKIKDKIAEAVGLPFPDDRAAFDSNWREISEETYAKFEAFQSSDKDHIGRVVFPIRDLSGRIVAFIGRHTTGGDPRYLVTPPSAKLPVFPAADPYKGHLIIVEGIFDAINLWDKGLTNTSCIFGTKNINEDKLNMLVMRGVTYIDIFMDGDTAGQKAAEEIKELCSNISIPSRNIYLEDRDPGSLDEHEVLKLKKKLYT